MGNGLGNSVQKLGFLPEAHTDFIMAVITEELGGIGLAVIIWAYLLIMFRGFGSLCKSMIRLESCWRSALLSRS